MNEMVEGALREHFESGDPVKLNALDDDFKASLWGESHPKETFSHFVSRVQAADLHHSGLRLEFPHAYRVVTQQLPACVLAHWQTVRTVQKLQRQVTVYPKNNAELKEMAEHLRAIIAADDTLKAQVESYTAANHQQHLQRLPAARW